MRPTPSKVMALVATTLLLAAAACGGNDEDRRASEEEPTTESTVPALPLDTPAPSADENVPGEIETAVRKLLADELDVDEVAFMLESSEMVDWSDASLGCPQEGMGYAQVITPGYKLILDHAGASYAVHTNSDGSHMVICRGGQ